MKEKWLHSLPYLTIYQKRAFRAVTVMAVSNLGAVVAVTAERDVGRAARCLGNVCS